MGSHENFRRVSEYLVQEAQAGRPSAPLESLFRRWISAMRSHEGYEEHKLYPFLQRRWNVSFEAAEEGHHALHERYDAVIKAFARVRVSAGEGAQDEQEQVQLVQALQAHDRVLRAHLELEEDLVMPLLLELSPEEFDFYCNSSIATLLRAYEESL
jgi:hemerythrin superfamily protein